MRAMIPLDKCIKVSLDYIRSIKLSKTYNGIKKDILQKKKQYFIYTEKITMGKSRSLTSLLMRFENNWT